MDLSVALIIAASFAILCTFHIGKRIPHHSGRDESKAENGSLPGGCKQLHKGQQFEH